MGLNTYIPREMTSSIEEACRYYRIIVVTGPRQSGKSTMCRHIFPDYAYVNLESLPKRAEAQADPALFLTQAPHMLIDEVQNVPGLLSEIQALVDQDSERRFVLTGSNNFSLLENVTQSLAGRAALFTLLPLSLQEVRAYADATDTDTLLVNGLYPGVISDHIPRQLFFANYYDTYVERDGRRLFNIRLIEQFQTFVRLCAGRTAYLFNVASLSAEIGVSAKTIQEWNNILAASYITYKIYPYYTNLGKRLGKTPKLYFYDVGLACYLLGIETAEQMRSHPLRGALFENLAVNELLKRRYNTGKRPQLSFYRERNGREVDVLEGTAPYLRAFEIKSSKTFHADFFQNLDYIRRVLAGDIQSATLVYDGDALVSDTVNVRNI